MGGDGGSFCKRSEQVKLKKRRAQWEDNPDAIRKDLYSRCALTKNLLQKPIVVCGLGNLYNKDSVLEHIVEPTNKDPAYQHIRSLKHVLDVKVQYETDKDSGALIFNCPVSGRHLSGSFKFVVMRTCGCMVSNEALTQLGSEEDKCVSCSTPFSKSEEKDQFSTYIPLFPDLSVKDLLLDRIIQERKVEKQAKLAIKAEKKKAKKAAAAVAAVAAVAAEKEEVKKKEEALPLTKEELKAEKKRLKKQKRKEEKAQVRLEEAEKRKKQKFLHGEKEDPRAKYDPRFKSKVFQSIFIPAGQENRTDIQFLCGVSTKALSSGFIT